VKNIAEFRRIQSSAEDVESHIVVAAGAYRVTGIGVISTWCARGSRA